MSSLQAGSEEQVARAGDQQAVSLVSEWKPHFQSAENVAVALAALEASAQRQQQTCVVLEASTCKNYPLQLRAVHREMCEFKNAVNKQGKIFTLEHSIDRRVADGKLWDRWKRIISPVIIKMTPHYYHLTQRKDIIPSGKQKLDILQAMKEKLWQEEQETKQQASLQSKGRRKGKAKALGADEEKENDSVDGGNMPTPLKGDPPPGADPEPVTEKMPADWDGGAFFKVWEILGPFGMNHPSVSVTPKLPSKRPAQEGGEGRKAVRTKERMNTMKEQLQKRLSENQQSCTASAKIAAAQEHLAATQHFAAVCKVHKDQLDALDRAIEFAKILGNVDEMKELIAEYNLMRNKRMPDPPEPPSKIESFSLQSSTDKVGCSSNPPRNCERVAVTEDGGSEDAEVVVDTEVEVNY